MTISSVVDHPADDVQFARQDHRLTDQSDQGGSHAPREGEDEGVCSAGRTV